MAQVSPTPTALPGVYNQRGLLPPRVEGGARADVSPWQRFAVPRRDNAVMHLRSCEICADYNEVKALGSARVRGRGADSAQAT